MIKKILSVLMIACLSAQVTADNSVGQAQISKAVSEQAEGDYPELKRGSAVPLASMQKAWEHAEYGSEIGRAHV